MPRLLVIATEHESADLVMGNRAAEEMLTGTTAISVRIGDVDAQPEVVASLKNSVFFRPKDGAVESARQSISAILLMQIRQDGVFVIGAHQQGEKEETSIDAAHRRPGRAGRRSGSTSRGRAQPQTAGPNTHGADERGFCREFRTGLIARVCEDAPGVRLRFVQKVTKDSAALRDGTVDLETGVVGEATSPELRELPLFKDRFVGVVRTGHALTKGKMTPSRYASGRHIGISRRGLDKGPIDEALKAFGLEREIVTIVGGISTALALTRASDLVSSVPERHTGNLRAATYSFPLPFAMPQITVSMLWHPRMPADPVHRWLRACVRDVCTEALIDSSKTRATLT